MYPALERRDIAFHEAGHALAAWRLGFSIGFATILPSKDYGGCVTISWPSRFVSDITPHHSAIIDYAGPEAELLNNPRADIGYDGRNDRNRAKRTAAIACRSPKSINHFLRWARSEARALVCTDFHCISVLAETLLLRETIPGIEATLIMESADLDLRAQMFALRSTYRATNTKKCSETYPLSNQ